MRVEICCDIAVSCVLQLFVVGRPNGAPGASGTCTEILAMSVDMYLSDLSLSRISFESVEESPRNRLWQFEARLAPPGPQAQLKESDPGVLL